MLVAGEVLIGLDCEPSDLSDPEVRASMQEVSSQLETAGLSPMQLVYVRSGTVMAALTSLGLYLVPITQIMVLALGAILTAWVKTLGRKVKAKIGDTLIEATAVEDVERLIPQLKEFQSKGTGEKFSA